MSDHEKTFVPAFNYDFLTPLYDLLSNFLGFGYEERKKIIKLLDLKQNEKLLDVGCGTGSLLIVANKFYPENEIIGIDIDEKILRLAQKKVDEKKLDIKFLRSNADKLPFNNLSFDVVVSTLVFHHLPTIVKKGAIKEIKRILKNNGRFLLVDFGKADNLLIKVLYGLEKILRIKEAGTLKDNIENKIPLFLKQEGFKTKEVAPRYRGMQYLVAEKI